MPIKPSSVTVEKAQEACSQNSCAPYQLNAEQQVQLAKMVAQFRQTSPKERTFPLTPPFTQEQKNEFAQRKQPLPTVWVKTPSPARLKPLYAATNQLMVWLNMPYFQAPPHAGGPGGVESLMIEKEMLLKLKKASIPVPDVVAYGDDWLALSTVGEKNLDVRLIELPLTLRYKLWEQAVECITSAHKKGGYFSQCFARNMMVKEVQGPKEPWRYELSFLDFEEDPTKVMSFAQAQVRDWALFLHSTATLISERSEQAQLFFLKHLEKESSETQQVAMQLFGQAKRLRFLRLFQWLGRDGVRMYQLGIFSAGVDKKLQEISNKL